MENWLIAKILSLFTVQFEFISYYIESVFHCNPGSSTSIDCVLMSPSMEIHKKRNKPIELHLRSLTCSIHVRMYFPLNKMDRQRNIADAQCTYLSLSLQRSHEIVRNRLKCIMFIVNVRAKETEYCFDTELGHF